MEKKSKTVDMEVNKPQNEKLSYEQLERVASELNSKCNQFYQQLKEAQSIIDNFNEIGMLSSLLSKAEYFESSFVDRIANKIQEIVNSALDASEKREEENKKSDN